MNEAEPEADDLGTRRVNNVIYHVTHILAAKKPWKMRASP